MTPVCVCPFLQIANYNHIKQIARKTLYIIKGRLYYTL